MLSGYWATWLRRCVRVAFVLAISPCGYFKEPVLCAVLIGLVIWPLSCLQTWWLQASPSSKSATEALEHPSISRVMTAPHGNEILVFRDFQEFVVIDESGEERYQIPDATPEFVQVGCGDFGWSCLFADKERVVRWHDEMLGNVVCIADASPKRLSDLSLSANGRTAAALYSRRELRIWQRTEDGSASSLSWPMKQYVDKVYVSPHGRRIALRASNNQLEWMDPLIGELIGQAHSVPMLPICHAWSSDERWFAIGADDRQVHVWRVDSQSGPAYTLREAGNLFSLALSTDGRWMVGGHATGEISVWHDGQLMWSKLAHPAGIRGLDLSEDDETIVTGCIQGRLMVHDIKTGRLLREIRNERN